MKVNDLRNFKINVELNIPIHTDYLIEEIDEETEFDIEELKQ